MTTKKVYSVAVDGPAGAGKSTMARQVARELGFQYVDTGAIYRTVGYHMTLMGIGPKEMCIRDRYKTGRGSFKVRAKWRYLKEGNLIEIYEIPYTTTAEAILDKVSELIRAGKIREIGDMRDETDLSGLKLTIDLKRGADPEKLMQKLFRQTTLMDSYPCNFNILIAGMPRVMGVGEILEEWTAWRSQCVKRRVYFQLGKKREKLHLLDVYKRQVLEVLAPVMPSLKAPVIWELIFRTFRFQWRIRFWK